MNETDLIFEQTIDRRLQKIRDDFETDPRLRKKQLSYRLTQVFKRHIGAARNGAGENDDALIGKHFSHAFIECCTKNNVDLIDNLHLMIANNPQEAKASSPFMKKYGNAITQMLKECDEVANRLKSGDFDDYLLYRQQWWDTEGGFDADYVTNLFLGAEEAKNVEGGIERLIELARTRFKNLSKQNS